MEPEKLLWMAVFEQAIRDTRTLISKGKTDPKVWQSPVFKREVEAMKEWFRSQSTRPGGFIFLCDLMDIDPEKALENIERRYLQRLVPDAPQVSNNQA